ncbi:MAG: DNA-3-methyladenine glycosylase [Nitriliruptorales bacterium]|nr:DNA-3-methyladenine glycosylase [Nitriliruptorales bacterium]
MLTDRDLRAASRDLAQRDDVMRDLYEIHGPCQLRPRQPSHFVALARAIVYQQLSGAAARTIWGRVSDLLGPRPTPEDVLATDHDDLRGAGLSNSKALSIRDLATKVAEGSVKLRDVSRLDDDAVIERLLPIRGIGPWTAEMFLIFQLRRPDVWPIGDLGVRKGYGLAYLDGRTPEAEELEPLGERFRPYRSVAAWYLWRATETLTP